MILSRDSKYSRWTTDLWSQILQVCKYYVLEPTTAFYSKEILAYKFALNYDVLSGLSRELRITHLELICQA